LLKAVLWDFGGVLTTSPFEAFNRYEQAHDIPLDFIRTVNATNPDGNAWAQFERSDISPDDFDQRFALGEASLRGRRFASCRTPDEKASAETTGRVKTLLTFDAKALKSPTSGEKAS